MSDAQEMPNLTFGPYITKGPLGRQTRDGQSSMFIAEHQETKHRVALRVLPVQAKDPAAVIERCNAALEPITEIMIPHSVKIVDYGNTKDAIYLASTLMTGGTLQHRMLQRGIGMDTVPEQQFPSLGEILGLAERMCEALDVMHNHDLIHGQIEPRNIMFDDVGEAYISDVGLVRIIKILYQLDTTNSLSISRYTPPELWEGGRADARSDQYSLACLIYELLTGQAPFNSASIFTLMQSHTKDDVLPPSMVRKGLPDDLAVVFWQALAKPPEKRHRSILAFYDELADALGDDLGDATGFFTGPLQST